MLIATEGVMVAVLVVMLTAVLIVVGMVGIVVPVLPGLLLVWGSVLAWALVTNSAVVAP